MPENKGQLGLVLSGGGARAAYQVGFLKCLSKIRPDLDIPILTGVSAGAINAAFLANHPGPFDRSTADLCGLWYELSVDKVFYADSWWLFKNVINWGFRLVSGGLHTRTQSRSLLDAAPLRRFLETVLGSRSRRLSGIRKNIEAGRLRSLAVTATDYGTGQAVTWVDGHPGRIWERPLRRSELSRIGIDHILASAALPLIFPAVEIENNWYGDGGIRQATPLSPAIYLGADKILAVSTSYTPTLKEARRAACDGYPPPAQIAGMLMSSIFLDALDQDARMLHRINRLVANQSHGPYGDHRQVDLFTMRPSRDLGQLAGGFEPNLPPAFRYMVRGLGTRETSSHEWLSMLMFNPAYTRKLISLGEADAEKHANEIGIFLDK
jgi:NTE family protein